jgi:hypothetical protein
LAEERCQVCGKPVKPLPYICSFCGGVFCARHRLPEKHSCPKLEQLRRPFESTLMEDLPAIISEFETAKRRKEGLLEKFKRKLFR